MGACMAGIKKSALLQKAASFQKLNSIAGEPAAAWPKELEDFLDSRGDAADQNPGVGKASLEPTGLGGGLYDYVVVTLDGLAEACLQAVQIAIELFLIGSRFCNDVHEVVHWFSPFSLS